MAITDKHRQMMSELLQELSIGEIGALGNERLNEQRHAQERAKAHPLRAFLLGKHDWQLLKAHLLDGGGVFEDGKLLDSINRAILSDDQETFFAEVVHLVKARNLIHGKTTVTQDGLGRVHRFTGGRPELPVVDGITVPAIPPAGDNKPDVGS